MGWHPIYVLRMISCNARLLGSSFSCGGGTSDPFLGEGHERAGERKLQEEEQAFQCDETLQARHLVFSRVPEDGVGHP